MVSETTDSTFETDVINSDVPVLVDFWAPWCGPCRIAGPIIDNVAQKTEGKAKIFKMNVDENPVIAGKFGITSIPTVIVFKNGQIDKQLVGVQTEQAYLDALN